MPIRKFINTRANYVGYVPSKKLGRLVQYESRVERAVIYLLEHLSQVKSYEEQPMRICYSYQSKKRVYIPDFVVDWQETSNFQRYVIECKSNLKPVSDTESSTWTAAQLWCKAQVKIPHSFIVIDRKILADQVILLSNVQMLHPYAFYAINKNVANYVIATLDKHGNQLSISDLVNLCSQYSPNAIQLCIWYLLSLRELDTDYGTPINYTSTLITNRMTTKNITFF